MANSQGSRSGTPNPTSVYLDSTFYFDRLITHRPHHEVACRITEAWDAGEVELATSALTLTEVLYVPLLAADQREKIDRSRESDILDLFSQYDRRRFRLIELDRKTAEIARELVWDHNVRPKDAVHVASALRAEIPLLFTGDDELVKLSGKVSTSPSLRIETPWWIVQERFD